MLNIAGIIVVIIMLISLIVFLRGKTVDNFIVFLDDIIIPTTCYNYLVTNGINFFLLNTKKIIDGVTNPMKFNTKQEALKYLEDAKCPINIPFVDLKVNKKIEDPTVSYQRECNKKIAPNLFDLDICGSYGSDYDTLTGTYLSRVNKIESDKKQYSNYDLELCMIDKAINEDSKLDDTNFKSYFSDMFGRMNSNIDEKYLYVTG